MQARPVPVVDPSPVTAPTATPVAAPPAAAPTPAPAPVTDRTPPLASAPSQGAPAAQAPGRTRRLITGVRHVKPSTWALVVLAATDAVLIPLVIVTKG